jgi:hypothetical protein
MPERIQYIAQKLAIELEKFALAYIKSTDSAELNKFSSCISFPPKISGVILNPHGDDAVLEDFHRFWAIVKVAEAEFKEKLK